MILPLHPSLCLLPLNSSPSLMLLPMAKALEHQVTKVHGYSTMALMSIKHKTSSWYLVKHTSIASCKHMFGSCRCTRKWSSQLYPDYPECTLLQTPVEPSEGTLEHHEIERDVGFGYQQAIWELFLGYVVCHLDTGFAVTLLSRLTLTPAQAHNLAFKNIIKMSAAYKTLGHCLLA